MAEGFREKDTSSAGLFIKILSAFFLQKPYFLTAFETNEQVNGVRNQVHFRESPTCT